MKNIEKYPNTNDALAAYNSLEDKIVPFVEWLGCEYEETRQLTLLEAAKELKDLWDKSISSCQSIKLETWNDAINRLSDAAERERRKPVLNFNRYRTAEEAASAFKLICDGVMCENCRSDISVPVAVSLHGSTKRLRRRRNERALQSMPSRRRHWRILLRPPRWVG